MTAPPNTPRSWHDDPVVWLGVCAAISAHAWMLFVGRYLPYIDWSNHLGLISILAHGGDTGAIAYADRSFAPTPYWLFYMVTAAFAQLVSVEAAAKLTFLVSTGGMVLGAAYLASATGRSPRLGLLAPLAMFGYALGYGFGSFVCSLPLALFVLGATERMLSAIRHGEPLRARLVVLAVFLVLTYLGHALLFLFVAVLLAVRIPGFLAIHAIRDHRATLRAAGALALAALPTVLLGLPVALTATPWQEEGGIVSAPLMGFSERTLSIDKMGPHLLERGSADHWVTMEAAFWFLLALVLLSIVRGLRAPKRPGYGLEVYAACAAIIYLFGPDTLERPMQVWMIYPRFATIAALLLFMLPRVDLSGWFGGVVASFALVLVVNNARVNRAGIEAFNNLARYYDPVREQIPEHARVLALTLVQPGDLAKYHPAMGSLFFYHLADGAAYTAFLFDTPMHPVRPKTEGRPRAPFWRAIHGFDPHVHGADFDYLVLRGEILVGRAKQSGKYTWLGDFAGWHVFKTKNPTPNRALEIVGSGSGPRE